MGQMIADLLIPILMLSAACAGLMGKQDVYTLLLTGGKDGLRTAVRILPALVILLTAVQMLRVSGAMDVLTKAASPLCTCLKIPPETIPLVMIRPVSGTAALAVGGDLIKTYGVDSEIGRTAAVMLGSTETTFYTISVYFGAAKIKRSRYAIPAALAADITGFAVAAWTTNWFF